MSPAALYSNMITNIAINKCMYIIMYICFYFFIDSQSRATELNVIMQN